MPRPMAEPTAGPADAVARFATLLAPEGQELLGRLREADGSATDLRLGTELRARYPVDLVVDALAQHELRLRARAKFSRAMDMFFTRAGLEQASAEVTAGHRLARYTGAGLVADLCCGIGGDLTALAAGRRVLAVDRDPLRLGLAEAVPRTGIKAAPGLPRGAVPPPWELEFIAVGRELKEAVAWSPALATAPTRATVLPGGHTLTPGAGAPVTVREPGGFLLDPSPAVTRAGVVEDLARLACAWKIDEQIAFLSADTEVHTPFARTLQVI